MYPGAPIIIKQQAARRAPKKKTYSKASKKIYRAGKSWTRQRKNFPASKFGYQFVPAGTPEGIEKYGTSWSKATGPQMQNRVNNNYFGKGDYRSRLAKFGGSAIRGVGALGGALVGNQLGGLGGAFRGARLGYSLGDVASRYAGLGDYGPEVSNQIMGGNTPIRVNSGTDNTGDIFFSHSEFIQNVVVNGTGGTTSAFNNQTYPLNIGLPQTFPWLSQLAQNFTMYELEGCIFEYRPNSGEFGGSTNALGKVVMATNYDPDAPLFTTTVQAENYDYATSCKPSVGMKHGIETDSKQMATNMLYVRTGEATRDKIFTDYGTFQLMTEGIQIGGTGAQTAIIGELWVHYRVKLSRANLFQTQLNRNIQNDTFLMWSNGTTFGGNTGTQLPLFADRTNYTIDPSGGLANKNTNLIGVNATTATANQIYGSFPFNPEPGIYKVTMTCSGYAAQLAPIFTVVLFNCSLTGTNGAMPSNPIQIANGVTNSTSLGLIFVLQIPNNLPSSAEVAFRITGDRAIGANGLTVLQIDQVCTDCYKQ